MTRDSRALGQAKNASAARDDYMDFCKATIPAGMGFEDFKIVVDASHGAGYKVAPRVMSDLGADVVPVGCSPNGRNINDGCGSTRPDLLKLTVTGVGPMSAWRSTATATASSWSTSAAVSRWRPTRLCLGSRSAANPRSLRGPVVGTVMSNLGLELALRELGVEFLRAKVGDRNVLAMLKDKGGSWAGKPRATSSASIGRRRAMG